MKFVLSSFLIFLSVSFLCTPHGYAFDSREWDELLKSHVENGLVHYDAFKNDQAKLEHYLDAIAQYPPESFSNDSREERIALWINVFNASVIRSILKRYPVDSVEKIANFWDDKNVLVSQIAYSFRDIREQVFRGGFREERALLALVPGQMSSGPLRPEAYTGSKLIDQLRDQMDLFLTDERYNQIRVKQKKLRLSPLFREYANDFILGYGSVGDTGKFSPQEFSILNFIKIHVKDPKLKDWIVQSKYKVSYLKKDVRLNDAKGPK